MISVPLTAADLRVAVEVGVARVLEALEESSHRPFVPYTPMWNREMDGAIIDYALGTLRDQYWPGPPPDPYFPYGCEHAACSPDCDPADRAPAADSDRVTGSRARIVVNNSAARPLLFVDIDLDQAVAAIHGGDAEHLHASPAPREFPTALLPVTTAELAERDARLYRKWIDPQGSRIFYWPGFRYGKAALSWP
jgi:hypothetical protein